MFVWINDNDKQRIERLVLDKEIQYLTVLELARKISGVPSIRGIGELTRGEGALLVEELCK